MKKELTETDLINMWMVPYHELTIEQAYENDPWIDSRTFYDRYKVSQEQHDEWEKKAKEAFRKELNLTKNGVDKHWGFTYLNVSPAVDN